MEWSITESTRRTFFHAEAGETPRSDAMAELWQVFSDEILPRNEEFDWD